ncbi:hypothetical protein ERO13_D06G149950v2 [Gossypium hirsutum]|nr:hypothetical protein ERO13_D06G149950v2 [Gossypium hirsutum]
MAKVSLKTYDVTFADQPKIVVGEYTTYNYFDITWSHTGHTSVKYEGLELLLGEKYTDKIGENEIVTPNEFKEMLEELFLLNGLSQLQTEMTQIDNKLDSRFKDFYEGFKTKIRSKLHSIFEQYLGISTTTSTTGLIQDKGKGIFGGYNKRTKALSKKFDIFLEHVLDEHNASQDLFKLCIKYKFNNTLFTCQVGCGPTLNLIAGGTKSSTVIVKWAILEMLKKLEIDKERWVEAGVEEKGIVNLPYIDSIAKETMRLHLVAPMLVPHQTCEHCQVVGYDILKCTRALVNVWTNRRDLKVWEIIQVKGIFMDLLKLPSNVIKYLNMEEIFGLSTPKKYPLEVVAVPRLPIRMNSH